MESGSYLRLKNLQINYDIPAGMLGKYGVNKINQGLSIKRYNDGGYTLSGFDYRDGQDNRVIPLVTYLNYRFVPVNK